MKFDSIVLALDFVQRLRFPRRLVYGNHHVGGLDHGIDC